MTEPELDAWLERPRIRTRHRHTAAASPEALWRAAEDVRLRDTGRLGRIVRWRIPGLPASTTFGELFRNHPFTVLEESDGRLVCGLVGRIWTLERDYPRLDGPEAFRDWHAPNTARVVFAHWVEPEGDGSVIVSEARVAPTNRRADIRLRALWAVVGPFERLIGGEALRTAAAHAES